ncbi:hypothetical protein GO013_16580 [Pseudodesulfovibrio sp. JC047]|nr:hypothetical protein [Pseudodesulfovibrio sp. JC047]NDV21025.1 hypothetical protein [Pseudodesulfovibrio sp. JC047]
MKTSTPPSRKSRNSKESLMPGIPKLLVMDNGNAATSRLTAKRISQLDR